MELWIRSQDKSSIVKVDNLYVSVGNYICYYVEKGKEVSGTYYRPSGELGRYKTKERALEVLDEIQNIIRPKYILNSVNTKSIGNAYYTKNGIIYKNGSNEGSIHEISTLVYEMPEK